MELGWLDKMSRRCSVIGEKGWELERFVKIKKRVAVTNQYAAAIRDDKARKKERKMYEIYFR